MFHGMKFGVLEIVTIFSILSLTGQSGITEELRKKYPTDFIWGAAFSAHQTEGVTGGGENGDWYEFEHPTGTSPIKNGDTADVADDEWNRYEEDIVNAKKIGLTSIRTSIAWEKVEPQKGVFSKAAIDHYHQVFSKMKQLGIRPMVCLHHFTHPNWFNKLGGWTHSQSPQYFFEYASYVVSHLSDTVDFWITFNEPMITVQMGYLKGEVPPNHMGLDDAFEAAFNTGRAHRMTAHFIHSLQGVPKNIRKKNKAPVSGVGIAYAFGFFDPNDPNDPKDVQATENLMDLSDWDWLRGTETGHMEFRLKVPGKPDRVWSRDMPPSDISGSPGPVFDWMGVNYYQRYLIKANPNGIIPFQWITPPGPLSDGGWSIYPLGLERILREVAKRFSYPIIVTENGVADSNDSKRPQFIRDHLGFLDNAVLGGGLGGALDVRGYYHWSLIDNFEWLSGFFYRFGLYEVQYQNNLKRVPRLSAVVFSNEIKSRQKRH